MYTIYSILSLVFVILIIVTAFITIALTYFQLAVEDHRWCAQLFPLLFFLLLGIDCDVLVFRFVLLKMCICSELAWPHLRHAAAGTSAHTRR